MKKYILISLLATLLFLCGCGNKAVTVVNVDSLRENISVDFSADTHTTTPLTENIISEQAKLSSPTLEKLLRTALLPVGNTMYIWGGGWNEEDTGAGIGATTIGACPQWATFAALQDEAYDYKNHRYEILNGLDCSGYVGWVVYNLFESEPYQEGHVYKSTDTAAEYARKGWGELLENPDSFLPGDIVSMKGHVWISLGMCADGSTVLVHASPPGVSICGTALSDGTTSQAVTLAKQYMEAYYPKWQEKYPDREVGISYTQDTTVMRWWEDVLPDAQKQQAMTAEEILKLLFEASPSP